MDEKQTPEIRSQLPAAPVDRLVEPLTRFLHVEATSGVVLLIATAIALILANSPLSAQYLNFWKTHFTIGVGDFVLDHSLKHWINDGLMVIFFFVVGLEVKREIVAGELREPRRAALPVAAALGGMLAPAAIYFALQYGQEGQRGWGIPMATDIAFVVGCMAVLGSRLPHGLRVMVLSLAIADDVGAILVIAIGYTTAIHWPALAFGLAFLAVISLCARIGVRSFAVYCVLGSAVWLAFHESGIHATIAGVILGLMTPARVYLSQGVFTNVLDRVSDFFHGGDWDAATHRAENVRLLQRATRETISPLEYLENTLHPWVGLVIMPVFALANAGVPIALGDLGAPIAVAVMLGLFIGKPLGIVAFSWLFVRLGLAKLPERVTWSAMLGAGLLAGIGFTMALFIAELALEGQLLDTAKIGVLSGSAVSAIFGMVVLSLVLRRHA